MTRDEAKTILEALRDSRDPDEAGTLVDTFVKLGMLRLDETKSAYAEMLEIARAYMDQQSAVEFGIELTSKGIKVVRA